MVSELKGMFGKSFRHVSIVCMNESIARCGSGAMHNPPFLSDLLQEYLGPISIADAALKLGLDEETISGLLSGMVSITPEISNRLGSVLGTNAQMWLGLQAQGSIE